MPTSPATSLQPRLPDLIRNDAGTTKIENAEVGQSKEKDMRFPRHLPRLDRRQVIAGIIILALTVAGIIIGNRLFRGEEAGVQTAPRFFVATVHEPDLVAKIRLEKQEGVFWSEDLLVNGSLQNLSAVSIVVRYSGGEEPAIPLAKENGLPQPFSFAVPTVDSLELFLVLADMAGTETRETIHHRGIEVGKEGGAPRFRGISSFFSSLPWWGWLISILLFSGTLLAGYLGLSHHIPLRWAVRGGALPLLGVIAISLFGFGHWGLWWLPLVVLVPWGTFEGFEEVRHRHLSLRLWAVRWSVGLVLFLILCQTVSDFLLGELDLWGRGKGILLLLVLWLVYEGIEEVLSRRPPLPSGPAAILVEAWLGKRFIGGRNFTLDDLETIGLHPSLTETNFQYPEIGLLVIIERVGDRLFYYETAKGREESKEISLRSPFIVGKTVFKISS